MFQVSYEITCDRCGQRARLNRETLPRTWVEVTVRRHGPDGGLGPRQVFHFHADCALLLRDFIQNEATVPTTPSVEPEPVEPDEVLP